MLIIAWTLSIEHPQKVLTIIHNKMDHGKKNCLSMLCSQKQRPWYVHETTIFGKMNDGS